MDSKESAAYIETAEEQLSYAEAAFKDRRYSLCVFLSSSAAENATSSLLISLGAKPSRKHRNSLVLVRTAGTSEPLVKLASLLRDLEPNITRARYPIRKGLELLPPSKYYTAKSAEEALSLAKRVASIVNKFRGPGL